MICIDGGFEASPDFASARAAGSGCPPPAPATREADRRQVTVLFADLTGFTALSERLDPEVVRAFQTALFDTLAQAIARYDGFVEKFVGDAVMAVFGAPVAHRHRPLGEHRVRQGPHGARQDALRRGDPGRGPRATALRKPASPPSPAPI